MTNLDSPGLENSSTDRSHTRRRSTLSAPNVDAGHAGANQEPVDDFDDFAEEQDMGEDDFGEFDDGFQEPEDIATEDTDQPSTPQPMTPLSVVSNHKPNTLVISIPQSYTNTANSHPW